MKFCLSLLTLLIWIPICPAQDIDMTKVCEDAANSSGFDAAGKANLRAACVQAAACSASCNRIINDGDAFTACIQKCVLPDGDAPKIKPSNADSDKKKDAKKDDKGDLCAQAADFRDHQLFNLWDAEQKKYAIFTEGSNAQVKIRDDTAKLMDDDWWAGSTGAEVAIEIKGFSDVVNDAIGLFVPEGQAIQMGTSTIHHAREIANGVTGIGVLETYTKENAEADGQASWCRGVYQVWWASGRWNQIAFGHCGVREKQEGRGELSRNSSGASKTNQRDAENSRRQEKSGR